jgi:hypothetical protein
MPKEEVDKLLKEGIKANNDNQPDRALNLWRRAQAGDPANKDVRTHIENVAKEVRTNAAFNAAQRAVYRATEKPAQPMSGLAPPAATEAANKR